MDNMKNYEVKMRNNVTGLIEACIVVAESEESAEDNWFEVFESRSEYISDNDVPDNWIFESSSLLECCNGCGGLRRPGLIGTGSVSL